MAHGKHVIVTASDSRCGDFLLEHWYRSLRENVTLDDIDVVVLDYGLSEEQQQRISGAGIGIRSCEHDGHITNIRYRDLSVLLNEQPYDQVLLVDGGDIIFQRDIRHLFGQSPERMRAVCDQRKYSLHDVLPILSDFQPEERQAISRFLHDRPQINGGFVLGPAQGFLRLWEEFRERTHSLSQFAADQVLINYSLHREGFEELPSCYNFVLVAARSPFFVQQGQFFDEHESLIPVVHNAGHTAFFRRVARFGYGEDRNRVKLSSHVAVRILFWAVNLWGRLVGGTR